MMRFIGTKIINIRPLRGPCSNISNTFYKRLASPRPYVDGAWNYVVREFLQILHGAAAVRISHFCYIIFCPNNFFVPCLRFDFFPVYLCYLTITILTSTPLYSPAQQTKFCVIDKTNTTAAAGRCIAMS